MQQANNAPMVRMEHIKKVFNPGSVNEKTVFDDFTMDVARGDFVSVVGSNGSGKTTMLNILCGSLPLDSGKVFVDGRDITKLKEHDRAKFIGRVFQDPAKGTCANLTILENFALADNKGKPFGLTRSVNKKRIDDYRAHIATLHMGLEDRMDQTVGALSGGQRQALALIISTMAPIDLLILDEHTAALDPKSSETVMELTERVVREKHLTTLMVTHNLRFAVEYGNRLVMMHQGAPVLDLSGTDKAQTSTDALVSKFAEISIELGN